MARSGDVIDNPVTGQRVVFKRTRSDTGGAVLECDLILRPEGFLEAEHIHPRQEERFTVREGEILVRRGGADSPLTPGDSAVVPPGSPHAWFNGGPGQARVLITITPAGCTEKMFETMFALARDGKTNCKGLPNPIRLAQITRTYDVYLAKPPVAVQKPLFAALDRLGRLVGYQAFEPKDRLCPRHCRVRPRPRQRSDSALQAHARTMAPTA